MIIKTKLQNEIKIKQNCISILKTVLKCIFITIIVIIRIQTKRKNNFKMNKVKNMVKICKMAKLFHKNPHFMKFILANSILNVHRILSVTMAIKY